MSLKIYKLKQSEADNDEKKWFDYFQWQWKEVTRGLAKLSSQIYLYIINTSQSLDQIIHQEGCLQSNDLTWISDQICPSTPFSIMDSKKDEENIGQQPYQVYSNMIIF